MAHWEQLAARLSPLSSSGFFPGHRDVWSAKYLSNKWIAATPPSVFLISDILLMSKSSPACDLIPFLTTSPQSGFTADTHQQKKIVMSKCFEVLHTYSKCMCMCVFSHMEITCTSEFQHMVRQFHRKAIKASSQFCVELIEQHKSGLEVDTHASLGVHLKESLD